MPCSYNNVNFDITFFFGFLAFEIFAPGLERLFSLFCLQQMLEKYSQDGKKAALTYLHNLLSASQVEVKNSAGGQATAQKCPGSSPP